MPLTSATFTVSLTANATGSNPFGGGGSFAPTMEQALAFAAGTGAAEADAYYFGERTVGDGLNDDIDLAGALADAFGGTVTLAELVAILIINKPIAAASVNTTDLTIGGGSNVATGGFLGGTTPTIGPLKPGAFFALGATDAAGIGAITAGTGDILRIANAAGAANTYQIGVLGRTA